MTLNATLIPGDGIGPEVTDATVRLLEAAGASFNWDRQLAGMAAVKEHGDPMPDNTLASIKSTALALKGPLETPVGKGFRSINVALRKEFDLYANVRPAKSVVPGLRFKDVDIILVRENTEGLYIGIENYIRIGEDHKAAAQSIARAREANSPRPVRTWKNASGMTSTRLGGGSAKLHRSSCSQQAEGAHQAPSRKPGRPEQRLRRRSHPCRKTAGPHCPDADRGNRRSPAKPVPVGSNP